jgi:hypothetical protein
MRVDTARFKLLGLLLGLALLCSSAHGQLAEASRTKGLPPRVASVLRWLPEDTETLIVARSITVPTSDKAPDCQDYGVDLACQGLALDRQNQFKRFDLRLISSAKNASDIPTRGKALIIVAAVDNVLHFRIFDRDGKSLVDTDEKRLPEQARQIGELRTQLAGLWSPHRDETIYDQSVIWAVTSIVDQAQFKPLRGRKIECVVQGARNFESVSKFGSLRSESCTIVVFESDLGDAAREWTECLRKGAESVRTLVGREVFVYPSPTRMDHWAHETRWQGAYFVLLKPDTLLCATSDRYLETVLRRVDEAPVDRALPDNLPEWRHVDVDAPVWMLRHVPKVGERAHSVGLTAAFTKREFQVVYLPKKGFDLDTKQIEEQWLPGFLDTKTLRDQFKIARQPDGTVVLSCGAKPSEDRLWFIWQIYWLQAFEFFQDER